MKHLPKQTLNSTDSMKESQTALSLDYLLELELEMEMDSMTHTDLGRSRKYHLRLVMASECHSMSGSEMV